MVSLALSDLWCPGTSFWECQCLLLWASLIHPAGQNLVEPDCNPVLFYICLRWNSSSERPFRKSLLFLKALSQVQMLLWASSRGCSRDVGLGTMGYQRMEMAELLPRPLLPALCPFGAQSAQENLLLCRHTLGALLVTAAVTHQLITSFCCCSTTLSETWPAPSFVLLPRQMSRQYLGDSRSPRTTALPSPPGSGNTGKDPEKIFWVGCREMFSARPMTSVN